MKKEITRSLTNPIRKDRKPLHELIPLSQPLRVLIDPCDLCNFKCKFCFQAYDKSFTGSIMQEELFEKIVVQLKEFENPINVIHLFGLGEPLMNKKLPKFIRLLCRENVAKEISITSNGSLLTHKLSEELVNAGLSRLSISLNGIKDEDFYMNVGSNIDFNRLYNEIKYFNQIKGKCQLHVKINGDYFSEEDCERFVKLFEACTDTINIDNIVNVWSGIRLTDQTQKKMYSIQQDTVKNSECICPQMFYELAIHSDGSVSPCCVDYKYHKENLGNVNNHSLKEIWNGHKLYSLWMQNIKEERINYFNCIDCEYPSCASTVDLMPYKEKIFIKIDKMRRKE